MTTPKQKAENPEDNYYTVDFRCTNCGKSYPERYAKGVPAILSSKKCRFCHVSQDEYYAARRANLQRNIYGLRGLTCAIENKR